MEFRDIQHPDIAHYFVNKEKNAWDLRIKKFLLEKWMKDGIDEDKNIRIVIADKNFKPKNDRPYDKERNGDRRDNRNGRDGRGQRGDRG